MGGWHAVPGEMALELASAEGKKLADTEIRYRLEGLSGQAGYQPVAVKENNDQTKAYVKTVGTKVYFLTVTSSDKIHSDGVTAGGVAYGWSNGMCSEIYMTLNGKKYSVGSHVYQGKYANPITWGDGVLADLIKDGSSVVRGFVACGTFDRDDDVDQGCVLMNVVDLADIAYTEESVNGVTFTLSGYIGPNDGKTAFAAVDDTKEYRIQADTTAPYISGIEDGKTYCGDVSFTVSDDVLSSVTIDKTAVSADSGVYHITGDQASHTVEAADASGNKTTYTITVNRGHTWKEDYTIDKNPTEAEAGSKSIHCGICDAVKEDSIITIPATGSGGNTGNGGKPGGSGSQSKDLPNRITLPKKSYTYTASAKKRTFLLNAKAAGGTVSYRSNSKKVTVNSKGLVTIAKNSVDSAVIIVTAKGGGYQNATASVSVTVKPAKIKKLKVKSSKKKQLTVKWKKNVLASGTEIQYSKNKKFAKKKTKKKTVRASATKLTIKKLKGTYYVRVRAFTKVKTGGKSIKLYSSWTAKKRVKIRK